jgi:hypothetical protein
MERVLPVLCGGKNMRTKSISESSKNFFPIKGGKQRRHMVLPEIKESRVEPVLATAEKKRSKVQTLAPFRSYCSEKRPEL